MNVQTPAIEAKAEEKIHRWMAAAHVQERIARRNVKENVGPYITLSREAGAGGSELGSKVAQRLGWDVLDHEIVDYLVEHYGTPRSLVELVDEKHTNWLDEIVTSWVGGLGFSESTYTSRLGQLFLLAAHHGNVVLVGRGGRFFLPSERGISVRVIAPLDFRVEQVMLHQGLNEKEARKWVNDADRDREAYVKYHFQKQANDPHLYDLVINVEKLTQVDAVDLLADAVQAWMKKSGVVSGC